MKSVILRLVDSIIFLVLPLVGFILIRISSEWLTFEENLFHAEKMATPILGSFIFYFLICSWLIFTTKHDTLAAWARIAAGGIELLVMMYLNLTIMDLVPGVPNLSLNCMLSYLDLFLCFMMGVILAYKYKSINDPDAQADVLAID